jgi:outer membrane immunogenic protein
MQKLLIGSLTLLAVFSMPATARDLQQTNKKKDALYMQAPIPVSPWSGWYAGVNLGYSWGNSDSTFGFAETSGVVRATSGDSFSLNGVLGGGQIGYNWQIRTWVFGLEADFQGTGQDGSGSGVCAGGALVPAPTRIVDGACTRSKTGDTAPHDVAAFPVTSNLSQELDWFGTVRGRVGYTVTPTLLVYATGGLAYGRVDSTLAVNGTIITGSNGTDPFDLIGVAARFGSSTTKVGWTIGTGLEGLIAGNWSAKIEYLYIDLGTVSGSFVTPVVTASGGQLVTSFSSHITDHILRVGVNYRFAGPGI